MAHAEASLGTKSVQQWRGPVEGTIQATEWERICARHPAQKGLVIQNAQRSLEPSKKKAESPQENVQRSRSQSQKGSQIPNKLRKVAQTPLVIRKIQTKTKGEEPVPTTM